jgi:hyperosmotically inducible periplasmic protein
MKKTTIPTLALLALLASLLVAQQPVGQRGGRLDAEIQQQVAAELQKEKKFIDVKVSVDDAIVTLRGEVDRWLDREDAEAHARRIKKVRGVKDELEVRNMPPADPQLAGKVMSALNSNNLEGLHVTANHGTVTVSGWVRTQQDRDYAEQLIYGIKGVERVQNHIGVSNPH